MALPKTDAFTGTNGTALPTYDANYSYGTGTWQINTNAATPTTVNGSTMAAVFWNGDTFAAAQTVVGTLVGSSAGMYRGGGLRMSGDEGYYFFASVGGGDSYFGSMSNGAPSDIGGDRGEFSAGQTIGFEVSAAFAFTFKQNGSSIGTASDAGSLFATGKVGMMGYDVNTAVRLDDVTYDGAVAGGAARKDLLLLGVGQ